MDCQKVDLEKANRFTSFFLDYVSHKEELKPFYNHFPTPENFKHQIAEKSSFPQENRDILVKTIEGQYEGTPVLEPVKNNIGQLSHSNTFTITTGHQLNIFTGPLYFIFKIVTVINACSQLKKQYPEYNFVPVYWMATEDHDFEEINNIRVEGKKYVWDTNQRGAVGHFDPSSVKELLNKIPGVPSFFEKAYSKKTLADAVRYYVNHLFGNYGLVVVDGDDVSLKGLLKNIIADDIFNNKPKALAEKDSQKLEQLGYKAQVFPRDINFFYLGKGFRERIEEEDGKFRVIDTDIVFTKEKLEKEIDQHPERFSPNVVLRPLYEEIVLPNLAYVGGPAEMVYWLQLKSLFDHYKQPFPILLPRNFGMVIPETISRKINKSGIAVEELFQSKDELFKTVVTKFSNHDIALNGQLKKLKDLFEDVREQAEGIDPTLSQHVEAQKAKTTKRFEIIEKKFIRAEKKNQSDRLRQIESVLDYLFPNNGLQERTDNFLNFYTGNPKFIDDVMSCFDPFDLRFHIIDYGK